MQFIALLLGKADALLRDAADDLVAEPASAAAVAPADAAVDRCSSGCSSGSTISDTIHITEAALAVPGSACTGLLPFAAPSARWPLPYTLDSLRQIRAVLRSAARDPAVRCRGVDKRDLVEGPSAGCLSAASCAAPAASSTPAAAGGAFSAPSGVGSSGGELQTALASALRSAVPASRLPFVDPDWRGLSVTAMLQRIDEALEVCR